VSTFSTEEQKALIPPLYSPNKSLEKLSSSSQISKEELTMGMLEGEYVSLEVERLAAELQKLILGGVG
jgi:hypothetical protein